MALRFFFDECTDEDVAQALLAVGVDVVTASGLKRKGPTDPQQFAFAQQEQRVIYSVDAGFLRIATDCQRRGESFCGLIFHAPKTRSKREIINALLLLDGLFEYAGHAKPY
jgi:hypothetical protein